MDILPDTVGERLSEAVFGWQLRVTAYPRRRSLKAAGISSKPWTYAL
jgi:hypothetical protein